MDPALSEPPAAPEASSMDGAFRPSGTATDRSELILAALAAHEGPLLRYALSLLEGDLERARDCVQDTFLKLCERDPAEVSGHLAPWLFTVCRNRALDVQRKDQRMTALSEAALETRPTGEPSPADHAERREATTRALAMLSELPVNQREVVRLKFQNQLSYQQIADITALSVTNVGFLLHTALRTMRRRMESLELPPTPDRQARTPQPAPAHH